LAERCLFTQVRGQHFNLPRNPATLSGSHEPPDEQTDSVSQLLFDFLMRAAEKVPDRRPEQHFIRE
jgi:hypothetical protein